MEARQASGYRSRYPGARRAAPSDVVRLMKSLNGPISDKLRRLFGKNIPTAGRDNSTPKNVAVPKNVEGHSIKGRKK